MFESCGGGMQWIAEFWEGDPGGEKEERMERQRVVLEDGGERYQ